MIIIKISKTGILIGRIFHFRRYQIILWRHSMEAFDRAWFGCCPSGRTHFDDYGIPSCNSNDVTCSGAGLSQAAGRTHAQRWRECLLFQITWAHISSRDARFIFSMRVPWFGHKDTFRRCFDMAFHDQMAAPKSTTHPKKDWRTLVRACQNT